MDSRVHEGMDSIDLNVLVTHRGNCGMWWLWKADLLAEKHPGTKWGEGDGAKTSFMTPLPLSPLKEVWSTAR
jgi:hypothetical protein